MNSTVQGLASLAGRILISIIFLLSAVGNKIPNFNQVKDYISSEGVPMPSVMLFGGIVFLTAGSLSIISGYYTRIGSLLLLVFLVLATYFFHDFWNFPEAEVQPQMIQFMKNLSLMGTMVFLFANGPGSMSIDAVLKNRRNTATEAIS